jgi:hypothetical protein
MDVRDLIGKRGEAIACARLMAFGHEGFPYFEAHPLGEKCSTYDFLVELVVAGDSRPYFLAQVKTSTAGARRRRASLKAEVSAEDVRLMARCPIPTYLIGVDVVAEAAYLAAVHGKSRGRISSIPTSYPLDAGNLRILRGEVFDHWRTLEEAAIMKTSAFRL